MTSASDGYSSWWVGSWHCVRQFASDLTQVLYARVCTVLVLVRPSLWAVSPTFVALLTPCPLPQVPDKFKSGGATAVLDPFAGQNYVRSVTADTLFVEHHIAARGNRELENSQVL